MDNQGKWFSTTDVMKMFDHEESAYVVYEKELHQIYTEVTHLMLDRWVVSFYESTQDADLSFYQLDSKFKPDVWLESLLRHKKQHYDRSRNVMVKDENNAKYIDFFNYIADNLIIHDGWNFIPKVMFNYQSRLYYAKLISYGFTDTPMGLIRTSALTNGSGVVPIYSFKS
jgi:hypothetical protein